MKLWPSRSPSQLHRSGASSPAIPEPVAELVDRALAFDRDARWTDARSMQHELRLAYERAHSGSPISSAPRLWVPATVPDRTLPSAGVADGSGGPELATEAPVANGISGQALLRSMSRHPGAVVAAAASVVVVVIVGLVVAAALGERDPSAANASSAHGLDGAGDRGIAATSGSISAGDGRPPGALRRRLGRGATYGDDERQRALECRHPASGQPIRAAAGGSAPSGASTAKGFRHRSEAYHSREAQGPAGRRPRRGSRSNRRALDGFAAARCWR